MSAADIFSYDVPFIEAIGPVILVVAVIANAKLLIQFILDIFDVSGGY